LGGKNEFGLIQRLRNQDSEPEEGKLTYVTKQRLRNQDSELKNEEIKDKIVQVQVKRLTAM
jgi:hypothetical protein